MVGVGQSGAATQLHGIRAGQLGKGDLSTCASCLGGAIAAANGGPRGNVDDGARSATLATLKGA